MLTRLYIENFRCFVNFEHKPARRELILGGNGAGKTSYLAALLFLREFVVKGNLLDDTILLNKTRWLEKEKITFELEADLDGTRYLYRLILEAIQRPRVLAETLEAHGKSLFEFLGSTVRTYDDEFQLKTTYDFDWTRSALATIPQREDNEKLFRFKEWLNRLQCFRLNPFSMSPRADGEKLRPEADLSDFALWYRHLLQSDPVRYAALAQSLQQSMEGFNSLQFEALGENVRLLQVEFSSKQARPTRFYFNELSDGQRCLICLYTILHFVLAKGGTVVIDEPENFISLREIQPWLMAATDSIDEGNGQLLLISHHPEILNQWAPNYGVQFVRDGMGPVRIEPFRGNPESSLPPAELIARGWDRE